MRTLSGLFLVVVALLFTIQPQALSAQKAGSGGGTLARGGEVVGKAQFTTLRTGDATHGLVARSGHGAGNGLFVHGGHGAGNGLLASGRHGTGNGLFVHGGHGAGNGFLAHSGNGAGNGLLTHSGNGAGNGLLAIV